MGVSRRLGRFAAAAIGLAIVAVSGLVHAAETAIICTNLSSGASWQIKIDYDRSTVDSHPASINSAEIKWHTPDGENYRLDRKSGNLTVVLASATGGSFLYDHCKMEE